MRLKGSLRLTSLEAAAPRLDRDASRLSFYVGSLAFVRVEDGSSACRASTARGRADASSEGYKRIVAH